MIIYKIRSEIKGISYKELWYHFYVLILSLAITFVLSYALNSFGILKIAYSKSLPCALDAIMTFTSIMLGFMGVLLTTFVGMKGESEVIKFFLSSVNKKYFLGVVKKEIISGLSTAFITISLYFLPDFAHIFKAKILKIFFALWMFLLIYFLLSTYRLMSLFLRMILGSYENVNSAKPPTQLSPSAREAMEEKYKE